MDHGDVANAVCGAALHECTSNGDITCVCRDGYFATGFPQLRRAELDVAVHVTCGRYVGTNHAPAWEC